MKVWPVSLLRFFRAPLQPDLAVLFADARRTGQKVEDVLTASDRPTLMGGLVVVICTDELTTT
jgi:hypothetical protein